MPKKKQHYRRYLKIKDRSLEDRPREKLIDQGRYSLTKTELLGLIIGSGIERMNAVDLAGQILRENENNLANIAKLSIEELKLFKGIGTAKAALIVGVMELASRLQKDLHFKRPAILESQDAYKLMKDKLMHKSIEEFWLILLDVKQQVIKTSQISKGGINRTLVDNRVLFKQCILHNASSVVLMHNHPSGNPDPSNADIELTKELIKGAKVLNFKILDHIIFSDTKYFSFLDEELMPTTS